MLLAIVGTGVSEGLDPTLIRDGDYASFLVPGVIVMTVLFSSTFSSASFYYDRDWGLLKLLFASPHSPRVILVGKSLGGIAIGSFQALVVLLVAATLLLAVFLNGFAQMVASRIRTMQGFHLVMNLLLFPLLFFSGAFFPLDDLPIWLKVLAVANPLSYPVDLLRLAVYADGSAYYGLPLDLAVLGALAPAVFLWGIGRHPTYQW